ncbi:locomotion-related protein Hikaru genki-like [Limulus polyphemus]|uniref:Locomotion-related protein Hikaru genki-like n=1 Tax=Limulus polyphemus TaxID=6850 RepID=A0ABM1S7J8_LIMPO|nr:locomotion-related protein Hikaru genki-like [Limulus polyphemus]
MRIRDFRKMFLFPVLMCWLSFFNVHAIVAGRCVSPDVVVNGLRIPHGEEMDFSSIQEIHFFGIHRIPEYKRICKIKCVDGAWIGPLCTIEENKNTLQPLFRQCFLRPADAELIITHAGISLTVDQQIKLPHGSILSMRCSELGMYKFVGNRTVQCVNGHWSSTIPHCVPTTLHRNFSDEAPPTITYLVAAGEVGITKQGQLVILPESIVHFDCLFRRNLGNPEWTWTTQQRQYPCGWAISSKERNWKYRLSIVYANIQDTGTFACKTPRGYSNSIDVVVKGVSCPPIQATDHKRLMAIEGTRLHSKARFACLEGYVLRGEEELTCTASEEWSHVPPLCQAIQCPPLAVESRHLVASTRNRTFGTRVNFICTWGYRLVGSSSLRCLKNQRWSDFPPVCEVIVCKPPIPPENGRVLDGGHHLAGDMVTYTCHIGFVLIGSFMAMCNDKGEWSHPTPMCRRSCEYPGQPPNGYVVPIKFQYDIGDFIVVRCNKGFRRLGPKNLRCDRSGLWSSHLPHCRPYDT